MGQRSCASMADVSRRRQFRSAKRRADAIHFLTNISLDGSVTSKINTQCNNQRQKDGETDDSLSKKDDETQGTKEPGSNFAALVSEPQTSTVLTAVTEKSGSSAGKSLGSSSERLAGSKATLINTKGRTRRLSGPAGEKSRSPPVSPLKFDTSKQCQRSVSLNINASDLPKKRLFQQQLAYSYDHPPDGEHDHLHPRSHSIRLRSMSYVGSESPREKSPPPVLAKVMMVKSMPKQTASTKPGRVLLLSHGRKAPFAIFSHLRYDKDRKNAMYRADSEGNRPVNRIRKSSGNKHIRVSSEGYLASLEGVELGDDNRTVSYSHFLVPTRELSIIRRQISLEILGTQAPHSPAVRKMQGHPMVNLTASAIQLDRGDSDAGVDRLSTLPVYDPNELDDPELSAGKHRKLLTFPSYMVSVVDYTKPSELKKDINQKFREKYPHIDLTLSKLRSIKRDMKKLILDECGLDALTLAQAYALYEKLVLLGKINKPNRKLVAGSCLILAAKLNDIKGSDLDSLYKELEDTFRESRKDMFGLEFPILVALEFSLHLPEHEVLPHYRRIVMLS